MCMDKDVVCHNKLTRVFRRSSKSRRGSAISRIFMSLKEEEEEEEEEDEEEDGDDDNDEEGEGDDDDAAAAADDDVDEVDDVDNGRIVEVLEKDLILREVDTALAPCNNEMPPPRCEA